MNDLEFDELTHAYCVDGVIVPSVTQILGEFIPVGSVYISTFTGACIPADKMEAARDFGTAVHKMIALAIAGELDEDALDPALAAVLKQWHRVCCMVSPEILLSETPLYCSAHGYAGTPDLVVKIRGVLSVIDVKTGMMGITGPQTAGYEMPIREHLKTRAKFDRYGLSLPKDGSGAKLIKYTDRNDWEFFKCRLFQYRYLRGKS